MSVYMIAKLTFMEASRRKILLAAFILGVLFLVVYGIGVNYILDDMENTPRGLTMLARSQILNFLLLVGLYVVNFLVVMLSVLTSVDTISGEILSGTIQTIISKPIQRWQVVLGKWIGFAVMLFLYMMLMAGGVMGIIHLIGSYTAPKLLDGMLLLYINGLLMLSVSLVGGTILSTLANGVLVFGLFSIAFVGGWIEQIGSFMANQAAINIGIISSLLMPSEALWKRAAYEMQSPIVSAMGFSPFSSSYSIPSPAMMWYAVLYIIAALLGAMWFFQKRDI